MYIIDTDKHRIIIIINLCNLITRLDHAPDRTSGFVE